MPPARDEPGGGEEGPQRQQKEPSPSKLLSGDFPHTTFPTGTVPPTPRRDLAISLRLLEQGCPGIFMVPGEPSVYEEAWKAYSVLQGNCGECVSLVLLEAINLILVNRIKLTNGHQPYFLSSKV